MKLARILVIAAAALAFSDAALAQHGGPGGPGMGPGGGGPGDRGPGGAGPIAVAPDGKAIDVKSTTTTSGSTTTTSIQLVAVSTAGTVAWTWTPPAAIHDIVFPTGLVVVAVEPQSSTSASSQIVALNLSTGSQAWATPVDGIAGDLHATSSGLLAVVSKYTAPTSSTTPGTVSRSLVSLNLSGTVVWGLSLD